MYALFEHNIVSYPLGVGGIDKFSTSYRYSAHPYYLLVKLQIAALG